ncbi:hypothetical protein GUJ93_ZPchr0007g5623 [Zizania palustris]|uniref:Uncharacterized protein n=1 Tax=Zizania palustris TaxID=103762 RepID=A0A8J5T4W2_ZIZPA|nr:hypothetical protein GUJ93_ZPchr0007g5623 [Zizania palustris]
MRLHMGNGLLRWLCVRPGGRQRRGARLVLWGGEKRAAEAGRVVGEVMLEHAGRFVVCRADGFRLGRPAPVMAIEDRLEAGATYLVLPVDRLPQGRDVVTAASLAALTYDRARGGAPLLAGGAASPFEYVKDDAGHTVIKVAEEFIVKAVTGRRPPGGGGGRPGHGDDDEGDDNAHGALCSTPELRKHYEQLVGATRGRPWSPQLETIKERNGRRAVDVVSPGGRLSPVRLLGLDKGICR